jgi:hypothetical protein
VKNSFFLVIPDQQKDPEQILLFQEAALQNWLNELPTANPGLATRLLFDLILQSNKLQMDTEMRLQALETLRPSYLVMEDYLRSRLSKIGFPKGENEQKIHHVLISLEKQFSIGYWIVVRDLTRKSGSWFQGKNTALSIQRVMKGLSDIIISHYIMSQAVPDWVWIDLHSLYKLGVKIKKDSAKVSDETSNMNNVSSIQDCYRQILLLNLADPSGLMQKEILQVYQFANKLSSLVQLESKPAQGQQLQCVTLIDEDQPPYFSSTTNFDSDSATIYLGFEKLFKAIKRREKFVNESEARFSSAHILKGDSGKLPVELLDYLEQRWQGVPLQGAPFFSDRLDRYFSIGLNSTHELQKSLDQSAVDTKLQYHAVSASETALSCKFEKFGVLSIGSMVSFRKTNMPEHKRSLGVITKLVVTKPDGTVNFEIAALTAQSHSANYLKLDATDEDIPQKALIYEEGTEQGQKSFLIIESFRFKDEDILRLYLNDENFPIVLRNKKNVGLGYWQFECRQISETDQTTKTIKKGYDFI